jgi:GAF domain-containing protein
LAQAPDADLDAFARDLAAAADAPFGMVNFVFAGNPVVDEIGIRSYLGAPLIDWTGATLGTICVLDREPRPWGRPGLEFIKGQAAVLTELIRGRQPGPVR